ncbi:hypothetical protein BV25DRAFT_1833047 [Artomyces pyxidatus]|uniref:Uncharacterized protein n=1 Tax=Artomyces pyxidatus TaxID=48021 RepID=A0ACB8SGD5_9AGAM|nr:hypothetical protein BV25DRAFT_1833047 [Artomyces pyxidatus]
MHHTDAVHAVRIVSGALVVFGGAVLRHPLDVYNHVRAYVLYGQIAALRDESGLHRSLVEAGCRVAESS